QIFQHLFGLFGDSTRDKLARRRIKGNLPRSKNESASADGLRIWADSARSFVGCDDLFHSQASAGQKKRCTLADESTKAEAQRAITRNHKPLWGRIAETHAGRNRQYSSWVLNVYKNTARWIPHRAVNHRRYRVLSCGATHLFRRCNT